MRVVLELCKVRAWNGGCLWHVLGTEQRHVVVFEGAKPDEILPEDCVRRETWCSLLHVTSWKWSLQGVLGSSPSQEEQISREQKGDCPLPCCPFVCRVSGYLGIIPFIISISSTCLVAHRAPRWLPSHEQWCCAANSWQMTGRPGKFLHKSKGYDRLGYISYHLPRATKTMLIANRLQCLDSPQTPHNLSEFTLSAPLRGRACQHSSFTDREWNTVLKTRSELSAA